MSSTVAEKHIEETVLNLDHISSAPLALSSTTANPTTTTTTTTADAPDAATSSAGATHVSSSVANPLSALPRSGRDIESELVPAEVEEKASATPPLQASSYFALFRLATFPERCLLLLAVASALAHGAAWPVWSLFFGQSVSKFDPANIQAVVDEVRNLSLLFVYTGLILGFCAAIHIYIFNTMGSRLTARTRFHFLRAAVRQEMAWHDTHPSAALDAVLTVNLPKMQAGMSNKVGDFLQQVSQGLVGMGIGFYYSWKLTLVFLAFSPVLMVCMSSFAVAFGSVEKKQAAIYQQAGVVANEILTLMRTVIGFGTYERELERYVRHIRESYQAGVKLGRSIGIAAGLPDFSIFLNYALAFWYGATLVRDGSLNTGDIIIVMFSAMIGFMGVGQAFTHMQTFVAARAAAAEVYEVVDRQSAIDGLSDKGEVLDKIVGAVEFRNVNFAYPTKPEQPVLRGLNLSVRPGQMLALVGSSGSGKSTVVQLLQRMYDPESGEILIDGLPLAHLNVQFLRANTGLVTQTPVLFPTTIYENIAVGKQGATQEDVVAAAKMANAHEFISSFPQGYDTLVGDLGSQLSGGQRQRIAIARVLINNPTLLLLDEATSALDNESERMVQAALENARAGRTMIVIAHRLSSIRTADVIAVMDSGVILEQGSHDELVAQQGRYYNMLLNQGENVHSARPSLALVKVAADTKKEAEESAEEDIEEEEQKADETGIMGWAWQQSRADWGFVALALFGSLVVASLWPANAIIMAKAIGVILEGADPEPVRNWCVSFIVLAVLNLLGNSMRVGLTYMAGERLTFRLRSQIFASLLRQRPGWFDDSRHGSGKLAQRLAADVPRVRNLVGDYVTIAALVIVLILGGLGVALFYCWRTALVVLATIPFLVVGSVLMMKLSLSSSLESTSSSKATADHATMVLSNVRLVTSMGRTAHMVEVYRELLDGPVRQVVRSNVRLAVVALFSEFSKFGAFALAFYYGSVVVDKSYCSFSDMFASLTGVLFCGIMGGIYASLLPKVPDAKAASARVRELLASMEVKIPNALPAAGVSGGAVSFRDVTFAYPARPDVPVLSHFSLDIPRGRTVALVGSSGSGKSTVLQLIMRMYDVQQGELLIDGVDVKQVDADSLRTHFGLVEQEPRLFNMSIRENVTYGLDRCPSDAVQQALSEANALEFIGGFVEGVETVVGELGTRLSGGQRQRVAIARALVRRDQIKLLLLDEATSALDSRNETLIHEAMDRARQGRTTIIVAHRLSTIRNADVIVVMHKGKVVETGTHDQLMLLNGRYAKLYSQGDEEGSKSSSANSVEKLDTLVEEVEEPGAQTPPAACSAMVAPGTSTESDV